MGSWTHVLSDINPQARTAICRECGPTVLRKKGNGWRCRTAANKTKRYIGEPDRSSRKPRPLAQHPYRRYLAPACNRCGFEGQPVQLDIHHVDRDHSNNDPANLETLCSNCHRLVHKTQPPRSDGG